MLKDLLIILCIAVALLLTSPPFTYQKNSEHYGIALPRYQPPSTSLDSYIYLDQFQPETTGFEILESSRILSQSFRPTRSPILEIDVLLSRLSNTPKIL